MKLRTLLCFVCVLALGRMSAQPLCVPSVQQIRESSGCVDASSFSSVGYDHASLQTAADYLNRAWSNTNGATQQKKGAPGTIFLTLKPIKGLGDEGYRLTIGPKGITIQASTPRGVLWGAQTLLQMRATLPPSPQGGKLLPCLTISDQPDYPIRGFMLDAGRKFFPMDYLYSLVNVMSFYKMNTLQLHLNDNGFKDQFNNDWNHTYAAFRMESDLFPGLTAIDGSYTKQEMREFIRYAASMGVEIIPEFDTPAHSLAFTHFRPSLASEEFGADHLNLRNPAIIPFLDSLYAEYLGGPDPVFCGPRFHIGTDEYSNRDSAICERFRELIIHLCNTVKSYGKQPVFWGSLTHAKGVTPVPSDGVWMSLWYNGYADPVEMRKQGFHMICIPDNQVYIVPAAGYYYDYLNTKHLFQHWKPSHISNKHFAHRDPFIVGGMFAVWNDMIRNGISVGDCHDRILPAMQVIAEKCWNAMRDSSDVAWEQWQAVARKLDDGPLADEIGRKSCAELAELKPGTSLAGVLQTGNTPDSRQRPEGAVCQMGYPYSVEFTIDWQDEAPGTVLLSSPRSTFYLSDPIRGMIGFSRDGYLFTFKYRGRAGRRETLRIEGDKQGTSLYADGRLVERLDPDVAYRSNEKKETYKVLRTLVFPLQQTGAFHSRITHFSARRQTP